MRNLINDKEYVNNPVSVLQNVLKTTITITMTDEQNDHNSNIIRKHLLHVGLHIIASLFKSKFTFNDDQYILQCKWI